MNATQENISLFTNLNNRLSKIVLGKVKATFGTPEEKEIMRKITADGIRAAKEMIALIQEGITYPKWKAFTERNTRNSAPLDLFENEAGDLKVLIGEFNAADLELTFDYLQRAGHFNAELFEANVRLLSARLKAMEDRWKDDFALDAKTANLQAITEADVLDPAQKPQ